jgi:hypothetical protein
MGSFSPNGSPAWQSATRYLTLGVLVTGLIMVMWWLNRLADHIESQRQLLVGIQRDVLVVQGNQTNMMTSLDGDARRLINVEERVGRAAEDRQQLREVDVQLTDALIRLRSGLDDLRERTGAPPGAAGMTDQPGPKARLRR